MCGSKLMRKWYKTLTHVSFNIELFKAMLPGPRGILVMFSGIQQKLSCSWLRRFLSSFVVGKAKAIKGSWKQIIKSSTLVLC